MKRNHLLSAFLFFFFSLACFTSFAGNEKPDTVKTGIYITSIHDIDFKQKEYTIDLWLWLKYKNKEFDFLQNLEIPQAKSVVKSFSTVDSSDGKIYLLMKLQCVMMDSWRISNFPFDHQDLRFSIENSQYDSRTLVFVSDTTGKHYDPLFTLRGWNIDSFTVSAGKKAYETDFGDETLEKPHVVYSSFKVKIGIQRYAADLFWKIFIGMYVAFLIAYMCFYIHADNIDSRFSLSVGALFAAIGNKYIIDSSLPESTSLTLVDILHGITLIFIFTVVAASAWALYLIKKDKVKEANRYDRIISMVLLALFLLLNFYFIWRATRG